MDKRVITGAIIGLAAIASAAAAATWTGGRPWTDVYSDDYGKKVTKVCDAGRAVYFYDGYRSGSMVIIDRAPECGGKPATEAAS